MNNTLRWEAKGNNNNHVTFVEDQNGKRVCTMQPREDDWNNCVLAAEAPAMLRALEYIRRTIEKENIQDYFNMDIINNAIRNTQTS